MGRDLWFRVYVARTLATVYVAIRRTMEAHGTACPEQADAYRAGFEDTLEAVAAAFGVRSPTCTPRIPAPPADIHYPRLPSPWE